MMGPIINAGLIISLFAIAAPFIFVLLIIKMTLGSNNKKKKQHRQERDENEELEDISKGLRDLNRRIDNLETLNKHRKNRER